MLVVVLVMMIGGPRLACPQVQKARQQRRLHPKSASTQMLRPPEQQQLQRPQNVPSEEVLAAELCLQIRQFHQMQGL